MVGISINILVVGYYGKGNLGDELFKDAFRELFPRFNFIFVDHISEENIKDINAIFFGGGSFLSEIPRIKCDISLIPIFYIGVGVETNIHPLHLGLMKKAILIAARSNIEKAKSINKNSILIPDLVYSKKIKFQSKIEKSVLIIPNIYTVPNNKDDHWKHNSWNNFKFEFSQFLDYLIEKDYKLSFFSMCNDKKLNDKYAMVEIFNSISKGSINEEKDVENLSKYNFIISQRFHGIILAEIMRTPYLSIYHHDKLKSSFLNEGVFTSFYGCYKDDLISKFNSTKNINLPKNLPIEENIFEELKYIVNNNF